MSEVVPVGWSTGKFSDAISSSDSGVSVNSESRKKQFREFGILKTSCVSNGFFLPLENKVILAEELHRANNNPRKNCVLFSRMNTPALVGQSGYIDRNYYDLYLPDRLWQLEFSEKFNAKFLSYTLRSEHVTKEISDAATGTSNTMKNISKSSLNEIEFLSPPLSEQKKIAAILTSVDNVIEKTQAQIDKLNDLKTGMMQELLTKGIGPDGKPHTQFKDSPVGRIPVGWEVRLIEDLCETIVDCVNKTAPTVDYRTHYKMIRTSNVRDGLLLLDNIRYVEEKVFNTWTRREILKDGDIVFTREAPVGEVGVLENASGFFLGQRTMMFRAANQEVDKGYLLLSLQSQYCKDQFEDLSGGSTVAHLRVPDCEKIKIKAPPIGEQVKIRVATESVTRKIHWKTSHLESLYRVKKALMQDLLTGKVRVTPAPE